MADAFAHCAALVRAEDRDRFLASLYAPAARRPFLHALYAFDLEIARIPARVHEPLAGELRLQWWREVLAGRRAEEAQASPVAAALSETLAQAPLPAAPLQALLDARALDLYADPMPSTAQFEAYAAATAGTVFALAAAALGAADSPALEAAARHAGIAVRATAAIRDIAGDAARGRLYLPADLLAAHGAAPADILAGHATPALEAALAAMAEWARGHLRQAQAALPRQPEARPAFLPLALVPLTLDAAARRGAAVFRQPVEVPAWRRIWRLWRAAR